jgi:hypothetical protein
MAVQDIISIDSTGNLYIGNYWVYINRDDEISFLKIYNFNINNSTQTNNKIINQQLKAKLIDDEIDIALNNNDENNFIDEEDQNNVEFYINNPETKYINYIEDVIDFDDIYDTSYYMLYGDYKLATHNMDFDNANYEAYLVDTKTNATIFYTKIINDNPFYRITINTDNTIKLNLIGSKIKTFKINIDDIDDISNITNISCKLIETTLIS